MTPRTRPHARDDNQLTLDFPCATTDAAEDLRPLRPRPRTQRMGTAAVGSSRSQPTEAAVRRQAAPLSARLATEASQARARTGGIGSLGRQAYTQDVLCRDD